MVHGLVKALAVTWAVRVAWPLVAVVLLVVNVLGLWATHRLLTGFELKGRAGRLATPVLMTVLDLVIWKAVASNA